MGTRSKLGAPLVALLATFAACASGAAQRAGDLGSIRLPPGFSITWYPPDVPVDVLVMPDGALLVSDDRAGAVYRITTR